jgi:hypothetical protein
MTSRLMFGLAACLLWGAPGAAAQAPDALGTVLPLVTANGAATKWSPLKAKSPFLVEVRLLDLGGGDTLHQETLRVEPRAGLTPSDAAAGVVRLPDTVQGSVWALLGAAGTALPDDLMQHDVWLATTVSLLAKDGSVKRTYPESPAVPTGWGAVVTDRALDVASLSVGGAEVIDDQGRWVGALDGIQGLQGDPGPPGDQGVQGDQGPPGDQGSLGDTGEQGPPGAQGPPGDEGDQGAEGPQGQAGPRGDLGLDPRALAQDRWFDVREGIALDVDPLLPMAFDGQHLWVVRTSPSDVLKIRASDGAEVASAVGLIGYLALDGLHVWVGVQDDLLKLSADDASLLDTWVISGAGPNITVTLFDGEDVWLGGSLGLVRFEPDAELTTAVPGLSAQVEGLATDGETVFVFDADGTLSLVDVETVTVSGSTAVGAGSANGDVLWDGRWLWVTHTGDGTLTRLDAADGSVLEVVAGLDAPGAMTRDGERLWVATANTLERFDLDDGAALDSVPVSGVQDLAFDGTGVWAGTATELLRL